MPRMTTCFFLIILVPYILVFLNYFYSSSRHQSNDYRLKTLKSIKMVSNLALRVGLDCRGASLKPFVIDWGGRRCYGRWDVQGERWLGLITRRVGGGGQSVNYPCGGWGKGGRGSRHKGQVSCGRLSPGRVSSPDGHKGPVMGRQTQLVTLQTWFLPQRKGSLSLLSLCSRLLLSPAHNEESG